MTLWKSPEDSPTGSNSSRDTADPTRSAARATRNAKRRTTSARRHLHHPLIPRALTSALPAVTAAALVARSAPAHATMIA
jgi:hypothetical protein